MLLGISCGVNSTRYTLAQAAAPEYACIDQPWQLIRKSYAVMERTDDKPSHDTAEHDQAAAYLHQSPLTAQMAFDTAAFTAKVNQLKNEDLIAGFVAIYHVGSQAAIDAYIEVLVDRIGFDKTNAIIFNL